jgi:hypothetical protein
MVAVRTFVPRAARAGGCVLALMTAVSARAQDECQTALPAVFGLNPFDSSAASTSPAPCNCGPIGADLWYTITPTSSQIITVSTCEGPNSDSFLAVYDACGGTEVACNDDYCGLRAQLSFCAIQGQTYRLRVGGFDGAVWQGAFRVSGAPSGAPGISIDMQPGCGIVGTTVIVTAGVTQQSCPPQAPSTVSADASSLGGGLVQMSDNGVFPDTTAGDGTFSGSFMTTQSTPGNHSLAVSMTFPTDTVSQPILFNVPGTDDAGELLATAVNATFNAATATIAGTIADGVCDGADADLYRIHICDPANFSATTVGGTVFDTQLFLFDSSGLGLFTNDDAPNELSLQSRLAGPMVTALQPGFYYLAVAPFDKDPIAHHDRQRDRCRRALGHRRSDGHRRRPRAGAARNSHRTHRQLAQRPRDPPLDRQRHQRGGLRGPALRQHLAPSVVRTDHDQRPRRERHHLHRHVRRGQLPVPRPGPVQHRQLRLVRVGLGQGQVSTTNP